MTDQFLNVSFQSKGVKGHMTFEARKIISSTVIMSVNPKDLHVDFVLPNFNLCLFENEADEEAVILVKKRILVYD